MSTNVTRPVSDRGPSAPRPQFIGIGAAKCGTSWIAEMLRSHPRIFIPEEKELHYFNDLRHELRTEPNPRAAQPIEWYLEHFAAASPGQICGEFTTPYLWNPTAPARIHAFDPDAKLLVALRDPVHRLFSLYLFAAQRGQLPPKQTFEEVFEQFPHMVDRSRYAASLSRFLDVFPREQIHVSFHTDLRADPAGELLRIHRFLGVEPLVPASLDREVNVTGKPAHPRLTWALSQVRRRVMASPAERLVDLAKRAGGQRLYDRLRRTEPFDEPRRMLPATEARLRELLAPDVERLETMLGVDLSDWKAPADAVSA